MLNLIGKSTVVAFTLLAVVLYAVPAASAQTPADEGARRERIGDVAKQCKKIETRLNGVVGRLKQKSMAAKFQKIVDRLNTVADRLDDTDPDSADILRDHVVTLSDTYFSDAEASKDVLVANLQAAHAEAAKDNCGPQGTFRDAINQVKADKEAFKSDLKAAKDYIVGTIKPFLQGLRSDSNSTSTATE